MSPSAPPLAVVSDAAVRGGRRLVVELRAAGERVPGVLLLPLEPRPAPAALLLHGYSSRKEHMVDSAGRALLARGVASLGIDLPLHGERVPDDDGLEQELRNPMRLAGRWRSALAECRAALHALSAVDGVDRARLGLVGYSMGAYLGLMTAANEPSIRAIVLAAGGDLPANIPFAPLVRAVVDPLRAVRQLAGRPLLMVNGSHDRTITPDQAERLYAAAGEPKELLWYQGGHWLPDRVVDQAATWLTARLTDTARAGSAARAG